MTQQPSRHDSFVLRIWWEETKDAARIWRGRVQHAATGDIKYFGTIDDLLAFIEKRTGDLRAPHVPSARQHSQKPRKDTKPRSF